MTIQDLEDLLYRLIGQNVREARDAAGNTQRDLANTIGVVRTTITNLEQGKQRVPLFRLLRIARELEVELNDLVPTWEELEEEATLKLEDRPETERLVQEIMSGEE